MATKFPQEILVTREEPENDEPYLVITEGGISGLNANEDGKRVAVYRLVEVRTLCVQVSLNVKAAK